jgi:peptidoglycan/LPS O-acetylase OafA/YrhL
LPRDRTVKEVYRLNARALNTIRLVLALLVLFSHAFPTGGHGPDPGWPSLNPSTSFGGFAVGGFFAISGVLVTMSAFRNTTTEFLVARFLRVVPAYLAVLLITSTVVGPVFFFLERATISGYFSADVGGPITYFLRNALYPVGLQFGIHDIFVGSTPYGVLTGASVINGSLWTLPVELRAYGMALLIAILAIYFGRLWAVALGVFATGALVLLHDFSADLAVFIFPDVPLVVMAELLFVFMVGAAVGAFADRLRFSAPLVTLSIIAFVVASAIGGQVFNTIGLASLAILIPAVADIVPLRSFRLLDNDLSYGTYLWAFPVQQAVAFLGFADNLIFFIAITTVVTLVFATLSWVLIERPALTFRRTYGDVRQRRRAQNPPGLKI